MPEGSHRNPRSPVPLWCFAISTVAALGLAVTYALGGQPQVEGLLLGTSLLGIGVGVISIAHHLLPEGPDTEPRPMTASTEHELEALSSELDEGEQVIGRRTALVRMMAAAAGALGIAALFPLRSLGPRPGRGLKASPFTKGVRLVDASGAPVRAGDLAVDGVLTTFPDGNPTDANGPTLVIRLRPGRDVPRAGREGWAVDDVVAYSKVCTHAGCPVGLYQADRGLLLCPCHQSTFDVVDGCRPVFGPATRSLPQLPLAVDEQGYLVADGGFSAPVGPGFWDQGR